MQPGQRGDAAVGQGDDLHQVHVQRGQPANHSQAPAIEPAGAGVRLQHRIPQRDGEVRVTGGDQRHVLDRTAGHLGGGRMAGYVAVDDLGQAATHGVVDPARATGRDGKLLLRNRGRRRQATGQRRNPKPAHRMTASSTATAPAARRRSERRH